MKEIERAREEKSAMEVAIALAAAGAVAEFKKATGLSPSSININMTELRAFGASEPEYIVGAVTTKVRI